MHWNYRIIDHGKDKFGFRYMAIHEVFYDDKDKPISCTEEPIEVSGVSLQELKLTLKWMNEAFDKPVIKMSKFDKASKSVKRGNEFKANVKL